MEQIQDEIEALRQAQPAWRADGLGVRGNPIEFHKEQARVDWPSPTLTERVGPTIKQSVAKSGAPEQPPSVPAS